MSQPEQEVGQMWPNPRRSIQKLKIKHLDCREARVERPWRSLRWLDSPSPAGWARTSTRTSTCSCHGSEHVIPEPVRASVTGTQLQKQRGRSVWHRSAGPSWWVEQEQILGLGRDQQNHMFHHTLRTVPGFVIHLAQLNTIFHPGINQASMHFSGWAFMK